MQLTFGDAEQQGRSKRTRREIFLSEMEQVVPWKALLALIEPHYPKSGGLGRQPYRLKTVLRIHLLQQWYALSDPAIEEALCDTPVMRQFTQLGGLEEIPDDTTILNFRRLLEKHQLATAMFKKINARLARKGKSLRAGTIVDATISNAPSSTKNDNGKRDPEIHQTKKGNQWYFAMKAHIGVDEHSGIVRHVHCTATNVGDVTQVQRQLHGREEEIYGGSGYTGAENRAELQDIKAAFSIAEKPSKLRAIKNKRGLRHARRWEHFQASVRSKVEQPFRLVKRQFGYTKVRYRGLSKNAAKVLMQFALFNLWMARRQLLPQAL